MHSWTAGQLAEHKMIEYRADAAAHRAGTSRRTPAPRGTLWWPGRVSVWCGYRCIDLGARLLRPALTVKSAARA